MENLRELLAPYNQLRALPGGAWDFISEDDRDAPLDPPERWRYEVVDDVLIERHLSTALHWYISTRYELRNVPEEAKEV